MLCLEVLDDEDRERFVGLVHDQTTNGRSHRAAIAAAVGGQVRKG